ncbi:hypothetical protein Emed_006942 [Eimeria media]
MERLRLQERIAEPQELKEFQTPCNTLSTTIAEGQDVSGPRSIPIPRRRSLLPRVLAVLTTLGALALLGFICLHSRGKRQFSGFSGRRLATSDDEDASDGSGSPFDVDMCAPSLDNHSPTKGSSHSSSLHQSSSVIQGKRKGAQQTEQAQSGPPVKRPRFAHSASPAHDGASSSASDIFSRQQLSDSAANEDVDGSPATGHSESLPELSEVDVLFGMLAAEEETMLVESWLIDADDVVQESILPAASPPASFAFRTASKGSGVVSSPTPSTPSRTPLSSPDTPASGASPSPSERVNSLLEDVDDPDSEDSHRTRQAGTLVVEQGSIRVPSKGPPYLSRSPLMSTGAPDSNAPSESSLPSTPHTFDSVTPSSTPSPWTRHELNLPDSDELTSQGSPYSSHFETPLAEQRSSRGGSEGNGSLLSPADASGFGTPLGSPFPPFPRTPGSWTPSSSSSPVAQLGSNLSGDDDPESEGSQHSVLSWTRVVEQGGSRDGLHGEGSPLPLEAQPDNDDPSSEGSAHGRRFEVLMYEEDNASDGFHGAESLPSPAAALASEFSLGSPLSSTPHTHGSRTPSSSLSPWTLIMLGIDDSASDSSHHSSRSETLVAEQGSIDGGSQGEGSPLSPAEASLPSTPLESPLPSTPHTHGSRTPSSSLPPWTSIMFGIDDSASDSSHRSSRSWMVVAEQGSSVGGSQGEGSPLSPARASEPRTPVGSPLPSPPRTPSGTPSSSSSPWTQLGATIFDNDDPASDSSRHSSRSGTVAAEQGSSSGGPEGEGPPLSPAETFEASTPLGSPLSSTPYTPSGTPSSSPSPWTQFDSTIFADDDPGSDSSRHSSSSWILVAEQGSSSGGPEGEGSPLSPAETFGPSTPLGSPLSSTPHTPSGTPSSSPSPWTQFDSITLDDDDPGSDSSHHSSGSWILVAEQGSQGEGTPSSPAEAPGPSTPLGSPLPSTPHTPSGTPSSSPSPWPQSASIVLDIEGPASDSSHHSSRSETSIAEQGSIGGGSQGEGSPSSPAEAFELSTPLDSPLSSTPHTPSGTPSSSSSPWTQTASIVFDNDDAASNSSHHSSASWILVDEQGSSVGGSQGEGSPSSPAEAPGPSTPLGSPLSTPHTPNGTSSSSSSPLPQTASIVFDNDDAVSNSSHHSSRSQTLAAEQGSIGGGSQGGGSPSSPAAAFEPRTPLESPLSSTPHTPSGALSSSSSPWTHLGSIVLDNDDAASNSSHHSSGSWILVDEQGSSVGGPQGEGLPSSPAEAPGSRTFLGSPLFSAPHTPDSETSSSSPSPPARSEANHYESDDPTSDGEQGSREGWSEGLGQSSSAAESPRLSTPLASPVSSPPHNPGSGMSSSPSSPSAQVGLNPRDNENPTPDSSHQSSPSGTLAEASGPRVLGGSTQSPDHHTPNNGTPSLQQQGRVLWRETDFTTGSVFGFQNPFKVNAALHPSHQWQRDSILFPSPSAQLGSIILDIDDPASDSSHRSSRSEILVAEQGSSSGGSQGEGIPFVATTDVVGELP